MDNAIGQRIKFSRKRAGLTQTKLAEKLGISPQMIASWEVGKRNPKIESLQKIANALSTPVEELTCGLTIGRETLFFGKPATEFLSVVSSALLHGAQVLISPSNGGYEIFEINKKELK